MKVLSAWRKAKRRGCTDEYVLGVRRAITMFRHCWVVDEIEKDVVNFTPYADSVNNPFSVPQFLDPKPDRAIALGIYRGEMHPHALLWADERRPRADPLRTFAADERAAAAVPLPVPAGCTDRAVLTSFHLTSFPPYDRAMTKVELQTMLVLQPSEVPHSGIFDAKGTWNRAKALRLFKVWKARGFERPIRTGGSLKQFLCTRGITVNKCSPDQVRDLVEQTLRNEASSNLPVRLFHTPYDDGLAEKKRRQV